MEQQTSYQAAWDYLRLWYRRGWIGLLTFFPVLAVTGCLPFHLNMLFSVAAPAYAIGLLVIQWRLMGFICPRCGQHYFWKGWFHSNIDIFITRRCAHCRLPKWSEPTE